VGREAELALLEEVARETYRLASFSIGDVVEAGRIIVQYADWPRWCVEQRHFRVLRVPGGSPFRILPAG
jgi:hypothetical protein